MQVFTSLFPRLRSTVFLSYSSFFFFLVSFNIILTENNLYLFFYQFFQGWERKRIRSRQVILPNQYCRKNLNLIFQTKKTIRKLVQTFKREALTVLGHAYNHQFHWSNKSPLSNSRCKDRASWSNLDSCMDPLVYCELPVRRWLQPTQTLD